MKGCFASSVCFDGANAVCRSCPVFFACRTAIREARQPAGPEERRLIHARTRLPKTVKRVLRRLFDSGVTLQGVRESIAARSNPLPETAPGYLRLGFDLINDNGLDRQRLELTLLSQGLAPSSARTQASVAMRVMYALGAIAPHKELP
tara:strand:- start:200 stop:643 length:444 start_codon:yes stop_codon:yes gene_type:complete